MSQHVVDYFKIPSEYGRLLRHVPSYRNRGFFRFEGVVCFGGYTYHPRGRTGAEEAGPLVHVTIDNGEIEIPFDPDEVLDNFRLERYLLNGSSPDGGSLIHNLYYRARKFLPISVRKHFQRLRLRGRREIGFPRWPLDSSVDELCEAVLATLLRAGHFKLPFIWYWPDGKLGSVMITHDIESRRGLDFCPEIMRIESGYGFRSSFEIIPERRYRVPLAILDRIRSAGCEVCIHGLYHDGHLFRDYHEFQRRAHMINRYARDWNALGFRSPVMYRNADWLPALEIDYDMSWPTVGHLDPQKGGCCTVMPYFIGTIVELPLTMTQDYSLFHILARHDMEIWRRQVEAILAHNGLVSCIIHPDYIRGKKEHRAYLELLNYLRRVLEVSNLWAALPREVAAWWRDRQGMTLVNENGRWRIHGKGAERARVAWATLENDRIHYEIEGSSSARDAS